MALAATEAEVAVTVGAKEFARKATDAVCANVDTEDEAMSASIVPLNEPVNEPVTEFSSALDPETITFFQLAIVYCYYFNYNYKYLISYKKLR